MSEASKPNKSDPQIFPQPYPSAACDIFNCRSRAKWFIGKPNPVGTWNLCLRVCEDCMAKILGAIPEELRQHLPAEKPAEGTEFIEVPVGRSQDFTEAAQALAEAGEGAILVVTTPEMLDGYEAFRQGEAGSEIEALRLQRDELKKSLAAAEFEVKQLKAKVKTSRPKSRAKSKAKKGAVRNEKGQGVTGGN